MPRLAHALVAAICFCGLAISMYLGWTTVTEVPPGAAWTRTFGPGPEGMLNQWAFYTNWSNAMLGIASLLLAIRPGRRSAPFAVLHLAALTQILVTGVVYNLVLAGDVELSALEQVANLLLHILAPILGPLVWLVFGPHGNFTFGRVLWVQLVSAIYLVIALGRGALIDWYPYTFMDVIKLGYGTVMLNMVAILVVLTAITLLLCVGDRWRSRSVTAG